MILYLYNGLAYSSKNQQTIYILHIWVNLIDIILSDMSQKMHSVLIHLCEVPKQMLFMVI